MTAKKYSAAKMKKFRRIIEAKMVEITGDVNSIKTRMNHTGKGNAGLAQDSVYSTDMAGAGSDSYEREKSFQLLDRESNYFKYLESALERIENGEFGVCSLCGILIPEERMIEVPNATKCVPCKDKDNLNL